MIDKLIASLVKLQDQLHMLPQSALGEMEQEVFDINRDQLYEEGIDAHGNQVWPPYRPLTITYKEHRNQVDPVSYRDYNWEPIHHVALIQRGGFYGGFYFIHRREQSIIWSEDPKTGKLVGKYGSEIFGIFDMDKLREIILPVIERMAISLTAALR